MEKRSIGCFGYEEQLHNHISRFLDSQDCHFPNRQAD